jgi:hypothetical protein
VRNYLEGGETPPDLDALELPSLTFPKAMQEHSHFDKAGHGLIGRPHGEGFLPGYIHGNGKMQPWRIE